MADAGRETWITGIGIVSCLGEGAGCALAAPQRAAAAARQHDLRALRRPPAGAARTGQADPEERRPAPDGGVAADRNLCGRPCARQRRRQRQCRAARAHGHDRRRRRRRARRGRRRGDPHRPAQGGEQGGLPQRAADERPAADVVPGAAVEPPGRQHFDRARRHRHVAHLHGRGSGGDRRGAHRAVAHPGRTERHRPGRRRLQCRAQGHAAAVRGRRLRHEGDRLRRSGSARRAAAAWRSDRSGRSWCWNRATTRPRATPSRSRGSPACNPTARDGSPAPLPRRLRGCGRPSRRSSRPAGRRSSPARPGPSPRPPKSAHGLPPSPTFPVRATGTLSWAMGSSRNSS